MIRGDVRSILTTMGGLINIFLEWHVGNIFVNESDNSLINGIHMHLSVLNYLSLRDGSTVELQRRVLSNRISLHVP